MTSTWDVTDQVRATEEEVKESIKQKPELIAQLKSLRAEMAAETRAAADLEEGELPGPQYKYIRGPSHVVDSRSQSTHPSKSNVCHACPKTYQHSLMTSLQIPVYNDPASPLSSKRKANDEGNVPQAKRQVKTLFRKLY